MSDFTTGYVTGSDYLRLAGIFCLHGNHAQTNTGSLTIYIAYYHWGHKTLYTSLAYGGFGSYTRDVGLYTDAPTDASDTHPEVCNRLSKN